MTLGPVIKLDKKKNKRQKDYDDLMSLYYEFIVIFTDLEPIWSHPEVDSVRIVCKIYYFMKSNFLNYKN